MNKASIPNMLTSSRFLFAALIMLFLELSFPYAKLLALIMFAIAGLTDWLDGYLARKVYGESNFGRLMDPLADKVMVCAALVSFVGISLPSLDTVLVPAYWVVIILAREFLVTGLRLLAVEQGKVLSAGSWGKHKTVWQIIAIILILLGLTLRFDFLAGKDAEFLNQFDLILHWVALISIIAVSAITVISGAIYFVSHRDLISPQNS